MRRFNDAAHNPLFYQSGDVCSQTRSLANEWSSISGHCGHGPIGNFTGISLNKFFSTFFVAVFALALWNPLRAQNSTGAPASGGGASPDEVAGAPLPHESHATRADSDAAGSDNAAGDPTVFIKSAAMGAMTEIDLAKLALKHSTNSAIRRFADQMLKSSRALNAELSGIAKAKGFGAPTTLDGEDQNMVKAGTSQSPKEFDQWYLKLMSSEQAKAVALFQDATKGLDRDLAGFAQKTLPALIENKRMADVLPTALQDQR
jgi:putative membrane protein